MLSVIYYIVIVVGTLIFIPPLFLLFFITYPFDRERIALHYASKIWARGIFIINPLWRVNVIGRENIEKGKAYVVLVNHQSMMDIPLMYVLPFGFKWVSKKEVEKIPIFGTVLKMHGDISIERGTVKSASQLFEQGCERLAHGTSINIFPEGTRSKTGEIGRFKEGAFILAQKAAVDILPCVSVGTGTILKGWQLRMPHKFTVKILPPVKAEYIASKRAKELAIELQATMSSAKQQLETTTIQK